MKRRDLEPKQCHFYDGSAALHTISTPVLPHLTSHTTGLFPVGCQEDHEKYLVYESRPYVKISHLQKPIRNVGKAVGNVCAWSLKFFLNSKTFAIQALSRRGLLFFQGQHKKPGVVCKAVCKLSFGAISDAGCDNFSWKVCVCRLRLEISFLIFS